MRRIGALLLLVITLATATNTFHPVSFCQRYSFTQSNQAQIDFTDALVNRFLFGNSTPTVNDVVVTGLFNLPEQIAYLNGSRNGGANVLIAGTARTNFIAHNTAWLQFYLGCRNINSIGTFNGNLAAVHFGLGINKAIWDQYTAEFIKTALSFGISDPAGNTTKSDVTYLQALFNQFNKGPGGICSRSDCDPATGYGQFTSGGVGTEAADFRWFSGFIPADATDTVIVPVGSNVHFDLGSSHGIGETDTFGGDFLPSGFNSGPIGSTNTFTINVGNTERTRYFKCLAPSHPNSNGRIIIQNPISSSAPVVPHHSSSTGVQLSAAASRPSFVFSTVALIALAAIALIVHDLD